jgi:hypothetical protein
MRLPGRRIYSAKAPYNRNMREYDIYSREDLR